ncbi:MAG TPA: DedA family protein [Candidatus Nanoarchaeia archaeon]|nr:DedA family protein [Candidatus Nanoarchaeia archaeon]
MSIIKNFIDFILHLDKYLSVIIQNYGALTYLFLFLIIFAETGLVITPFLPGDSLLFAAGTFAAIGALNVMWVFAIIAVAAILGDTINYSIGKFLGSKAFERYPKIFKKEYLDKTHKFYSKYGNKTLVLARFVPIVRTFAPFVAGVGKMKYSNFLLYNIVGGIVWTALFVFGGYYFGNIPIVKNNFSIVIIVIIIFSFMPIAWEYWRHKKSKAKK